MEGLLRLYIRKYRSNFLPVSLFLLSLFIIYRIIFPQLTTISRVRQDISGAEARVNDLSTSLATLRSLTDADIEEKFKKVNSALPANKDIVTIFTTMTSVASDTDVEVESFTINVGDVYKKNKDQGEQVPAAVQTVAPALDIQLGVEASSYENVVQFSNKLQNSLPLSEVKSVSAVNNNGQYKISFFYKPYQVEDLEVQKVIQPLSATEQKQLEGL